MGGDEAEPAPAPPTPRDPIRPFMLSPPPLECQPPSQNDCWAAAYSSFRAAKGILPTLSRNFLVSHFKGCLGPNNKLLFSNYDSVYGELGVTWHSWPRSAFTFAAVRRLLQEHGHLLLDFTSNAAGDSHQVVIFGVGVGDDGAGGRFVSDQFFSAMYPHTTTNHCLLGNFPFDWGEIRGPLRFGVVSSPSGAARCRQP